jgi:hypothetical protein
LNFLIVNDRPLFCSVYACSLYRAYSFLRLSVEVAKIILAYQNTEPCKDSVTCAKVTPPPLFFQERVPVLGATLKEILARGVIVDLSLSSAEGKPDISDWGYGFSVNPEGYTKMMVTEKAIELLKTRSDVRVCGYTATSFKPKNEGGKLEASFTVWRFNLLPLEIAKECAFHGMKCIGTKLNLTSRLFPDPAFFIALPSESDDSDGDDCPW